MMKNNDIIVTATGAIGIYRDGEIRTPDGDPLGDGAAEFALRMIPGDPDVLDVSFPAGDQTEGIIFPETRVGSKGLTVVLLQQALSCRGFYQGKIDGDFGEKTHKALYNFRRSAGLYGETVADMEVYKKLFSEEQEKSSQ